MLRQDQKNYAVRIQKAESEARAVEANSGAVLLSKAVWFLVLLCFACATNMRVFSIYFGLVNNG